MHTHTHTHKLTALTQLEQLYIKACIGTTHRPGSETYIDVVPLDLANLGMYLQPIIALMGRIYIIKHS